MNTPVALEGVHTLKHALRFGARITEILTDDLERALDVVDLVAPELRTILETRAQVIGTPDFRARTAQPVPTHVLAYAERPRWTFAEALPAPDSPTILLDDPRNSKNLGAVIRVAAATCAAGVLARTSTDICDPMVVRGAAGLQWAIPCLGSPDLLTDLDAVRTQVAVVGLDASGVPFDPATLSKPTIFAFGSERSGLTDEVRSRCDQIVCLPMRPGVSSLNLATSVSAVLYLAMYARRVAPSQEPECWQTPVHTP